MTLMGHRRGLQYGIYLPLAGDVEIQFTLELKQFLSPNDKSNLSFGVLNVKDGSPTLTGRCTCATLLPNARLT